MFKAREKNAGWRIDYWLVSDRWADRIEDSVFMLISRAVTIAQSD